MLFEAQGQRSIKAAFSKFSKEIKITHVDVMNIGVGNFFAIPINLCVFHAGVYTTGFRKGSNHSKPVTQLIIYGADQFTGHFDRLRRAAHF